MRYLDLDTASKYSLSTTKAPSQSAQEFGKKKKRLLIGGFIISLIILAGFVGNIFFSTDSLGQLFKAPQAAISFIQKPENVLKSTNGRTNILLLGIDRRSYEPYTYKGANSTITHNCFRSDTMVIASIDIKSKNKDIVFFSVPRDLWVQLPGWSYGIGQKFYAQGQKINAANCFGDQYNYPDGGGLGLVRKATEDVLGIPVHYVVRTDFDGFKKMVDSVGGINIIVDQTFTDCEYPIEGQESNPLLNARYKCVYFKAGPQFMNSEQALEYSRSRHAAGNEGSDLARAKRQQKIISAVRDKALSIQTLSDPIKIKDLIDSLGETFQTLDVDFSQIGSFYKLAQEVKTDEAQNLVLSNNADSGDTDLLQVGNPALYGGAFVFIPTAGQDAYTDIHAFVQRHLMQASSVQGITTNSAQTSRR
jgi:polyisoprenyl-teichoic acid--peptidoglycan teichoic acid transferase